jgi:hypothetical protein
MARRVGASAGSQSLLASARPRQPRPHARTERFAPPAPGAADRRRATREQQRVVLAPGQTSASIVLRVRPAPRVEGTVTRMDRPLLGVLIEAVGSGNPSRRSRTGADGSFDLRLVPTGPIRFHVDGYDVAAPESLNIDTLRVTGVRVDVIASDVEAATTPDAPISLGDLRIYGTVIDATGEAQPFAAVEATGPTRIAGTTTDMVDHFDVENRAPGAYLLSADALPTGHGSTVANAARAVSSARSLPRGRAKRCRGSSGPRRRRASRDARRRLDGHGHSKNRWPSPRG